MYTSKNTSVNSKKAAAAYNFIGYEMQGKAVLDYGCGRYPKVSCDTAVFYGAKDFQCFDPYWRPYANVRFAAYDIVICANVLNVLSTRSEIKRVVFDCLAAMAVGGKVVFQIYEGDKTGLGRETKPDCWQRNEVTTAYVSLIQEVVTLMYWDAYSVERYKNFITVSDKIPF